MGYPGSLPILDDAAVQCAVRMGASVYADLATTMFFERKRYAYPDLSKGYQTTQKTSPVWCGGRLECEWGSLALIRAQIEEDAASVERHPDGFRMDFARAGAPLLEIVSDVAELTRERVVQTLRTLHRQALLLGVTEGKIEEGQLKSDINLSLRPRGSLYFSERWEIKGVSSFETAGLAFDDAMAQRLRLLLDCTQSVEARLGKATTLGFSEDSKTCYAMRTKISEHQYRFLPCPDLGEVEVPDVQGPVHTFQSTLTWLQCICGEDLASQRWLSVMDHRAVLGFFGHRAHTDAPREAALWSAVAWLMEHPDASPSDVWLALRASSDDLSLKVALGILVHAPWSQKAFDAALQCVATERHEWEKATVFLKMEFVRRLATDPKFSTALQDVKAGKAKAVGYLQGQLMGALKKEGLPAMGDLLGSWLTQRMQEHQSI